MTEVTSVAWGGSKPHDKCLSICERLNVTVCTCEVGDLNSGAQVGAQVLLLSYRVIATPADCRRMTHQNGGELIGVKIGRNGADVKVIDV